MATDIDLDQLDRLLAAGANLIEVLPEGEYGEEHLLGAIDIPLLAALEVEPEGTNCADAEADGDARPSTAG